MAKSSKRISISRNIEGLDNEDLVDIVRNTNKDSIYNCAYNLLQNRVKTKIMFVIRHFFIPGLSYEDIFQEALYALRYKAIPDYDRKRGRDNKPYPFEKFAMLCIRRHLSTILKCAFQNKKRALNTSLSLDQDRGQDHDENLFLADILPKTKGTVADNIGEQEYNKSLFYGLLKDLSILEKRVFKLYAHRYSYEEISVIINQYYRKNKLRKRTDVKSIDNALSRIKQKAKEVYTHNKDDETDK